MSNTAEKPRINEPFIPITATILRHLWQDKSIKARQYIAWIVDILRPPGAELFINDVPAFCEEWGIGQATYYKAISELAAKGTHVWRSTGGIGIRRLSNVVQLSNHPQSEKRSTSRKNHSKTVETRSINVESSSTSVESNSTNVETDSTNVENRSLKQPDSNASSVSLDQYDLDQYLDHLKEREKGAIAPVFDFDQNAVNSQEQGSKLDPPIASTAPVNPIGTEQPIAGDTGAPAEKTYSSFNWKEFDWSRYERLGDGGSDPDYWNFARGRVESLARRREQHPDASKELIGDIPAYTLACIRSRGADGYEAFLIDRGLLPPKPKQQGTPSKKPAKQQQQAQQNPVEQWHDRAKRCDRLIQEGSVDQALNILQAVLHGGPTYSADRKQVEWMLSNFPHWGITLVGDRLVAPADIRDMSEVIAQIGVHLKRLNWDEQTLSAHLYDSYKRKRLGALTDEDTTDFLFYLEGQ